ncbi:MAG: hypothetical protein LUQ50_12225 [Methanospirillum sp.]|uniref:hypothetical protein n=1 Tax=Methanospirillum sp. TaxID=45200 RepID=UPI0023747C0C|nr:hypothetical protein [Methanospirillum sp.]MDD1729823.1 hypothetical protein [Methanospirillum sp.]
MICGHWAPDPGEGGWCLICNQGRFDSIVLQSDNKQLLEMGKTFFQPWYDRSLSIIPLVEVRSFELDFEEIPIPIGLS